MRTSHHQPHPHALTLVLLVALGLGACGGPASAVRVTTPAPVASDTVLAYTTADNAGGGVTGIAGRDGSTRWHTEAGLADSTPNIVGGVLYAFTTDVKSPTDGAAPMWEVVAVRLRDGTLLWRTPVQYPLVIASDGATVAVNTSRDGLYALDAANGTIRWHQPIPTAGRPVVRDGVVYALLAGDPTSSQDVAGLAAFRADDGEELWRSANGLVGDRFEVTGGALYGNYGYCTAVALNPADGHERWENTSAGRVIAATDRLVLVNSEHLAALDPRDGHELWRSAADFGTYAFSYDVLAVTDTTIYGSHLREVIAVRAGDGSAAWTVHFDPYGVGGVIAEGGAVYAFLDPPYHQIPRTSDCTPRIVALDGATGALYWSRDVPDGQSLAEPVG